MIGPHVFPCPLPEGPHQFHQRAVAVHIAGRNDVRDGEDVAIDVVRTQALAAIDRLGATTVGLPNADTTGCRSVLMWPTPVPSSTAPDAPCSCRASHSGVTAGVSLMSTAFRSTSVASRSGPDLRGRVSNPDRTIVLPAMVPIGGTSMLAKASMAWEFIFLALQPRMMTPFVLFASAENTMQTSAKSASAATTMASRRLGIASLPLSPPGNA